MNDGPVDDRTPGGRVTLKQIAATLGVTPMTVSNAFNRPDQLSPALRQRVLSTARELGYGGPDPTARGLRRGRTGAVGVIYDNRLSYAFEDAAAVAFLRGVSAAAEEAELGLLLVPGSSTEPRNADVVHDAMVDGFVVYSVAEQDALVRAALHRGRPVVVVDQPRVANAAFVGIDDAAAARAAAAHLVGAGHRRLAVVSFGLARDGRRGLAGDVRQAEARYPVSRARLAGYAAATREAGIPWSQVPVFECPGSAPALGREAARALLSAPHPPTAIVATSDRLALGVIAAAAEAGLSVPGDLSVVGFDDIPEAADSRPPLTTVTQDHAAKGRLAGSLLIARVRGSDETGSHLLPSRLVVRGSTGPPA